MPVREKGEKATSVVYSMEAAFSCCIEDESTEVECSVKRVQASIFAPAQGYELDMRIPANFLTMIIELK
jgi:hypothetical protein